ncbi:MAG TPA: EboA domain-containing protein [Jiangellaceae bacterium]|nr:EboA domain-containing protein [Jiangellaceae bacterium]
MKIHPYLEPKALAALDAAARERFSGLIADITRDPIRIRVHFPAAARVVARGPLRPEDPQGLIGPTLDDAVRGALLATYGAAVGGAPAVIAEEVNDLYRYGDADEKRAVLRALDRLPVGAAAVPVVADALRTNDTRLVAAALGPYGAEHLDDQSWRQGVLKCLFVGVPLVAVARLAERADDQLARMVAAFATERVAAGRDVPADAWLVLDRFPAALADSGLVAELDSPYPDRRKAAARALAGRIQQPTSTGEA